MKKVRRIVALVLALVMIMSAPLQSISTYAAKEVDVTTEQEADNSMVLDGETAEETEDRVKNEESEPVNDGVQITDEMYQDEDTTSVEGEPEEDVDRTTVTEIDRDTIDAEFTLEDLSAAEKLAILNEDNVRDTDMVPVIIEFDSEAIIESNSEAEYNFFTKLKVKALEVGQNIVINRIENKVLDGEELEIAYNYTWVMNGIATEVPYGMINDIKKIDGVRNVFLQEVYEACTVEESDEATPYTVADGVMIGREESWAAGYTGEGIKIAILDTGIDEDHQNFQPLSEELIESNDNYVDADFVAERFADLVATKNYDGLTVNDVCKYGSKIVYAFNYADFTLNINHAADSQGDHGTHVAGIAAANAITEGEYAEEGVVGVAPDAQLYVMKVFGVGGAATEVLLAAIEDSLILEADVINMSLGSNAGFSSGGEVVDTIYERVSSTDTILAIAAGNAATSASGNMWGTDMNTTANPDNAIISSPATYASATSVASVNNVASKSYYVSVNDQKMAYSDASSGLNAAMLTLGGQEYGYAMVGNYGKDVSDFTEADVNGKIAIVQRGGGVYFSAKCENAQAAGAVACIIYNNTSGTIGLDMTGSTATIPCVSMTLADGEFLAAALEADADAKLYISDEQGIIPSALAYTMSDFTSWGVSPDLSLEPDIAGPGGDIYSTRDGGTYGLMSGTSMATPNVAGIAAVVKQYVNEKYPDMGLAEQHEFVNALLVSTSVPLMYDDTTAYSPRVQGSGLANAYAAITTGAYLSVDGADVPKAELYDDPSKTGTYTYSFDVNSISDKDLYYALDTVIQTEDYYAIETYEFMASTPITLSGTTGEASDAIFYTLDYTENGARGIEDAFQLLVKVLDEKDCGEAEFRYDVDNNEASEIDDVQAYLNLLVGLEVEGADFDEEILKVEAGETVTVDVAVNVDAAGKSFMDAHFENGIYVEGFTYLTAVSEDGVDLSLPYMGFYGDWTEAPLFDSGYWWDNSMYDANQYPHVLFTSIGGEDLYNWNIGLNPYINETFDMSHMSVSPNGDYQIDTIEDMYISLMRNARTLTFTFEDAETGEVYNQNEVEFVDKAYYYSAYGQIIPYVYLWGLNSLEERYMFTDNEGNTLPNGTVVNLVISGELDYDKHESNNDYDTMVFPITVDLEAPELLDYSEVYTGDDGRKYVNIVVDDNVGVAAAIVTSTGLGTVYDYYNVVEGETLQIDVTGCGDEFAIVLGDYAANESAFYFETSDNDPAVDDSLLYGYRTFDTMYTDDSLFGWVSVDPKTATVTPITSEYYMDYAISAATYVGEYIVAVDANNELLFVEPGYWDDRRRIGDLDIAVTQLAFDASSETLYAYCSDENAIYTIDLDTAETTLVGENRYDDDWNLVANFNGIRAMACDTDGTLYAINYYGTLLEITLTGDPSTATTTELYDVTTITGEAPYYTNSMTFVDGTLYWSAFIETMDYETWTSAYTGELVKITIGDTVTAEVVSEYAGDSEIVGLLSLNNNGFEFEETTVTGVVLDREYGSTLVGGKLDVFATITPWYDEDGEVVWTSSDETIATVSERGKVTGLNVGTVTITATVINENGEEFTAECEISVVDPQADFDGFMLYSYNYLNQWVEFTAEDPDDVTVGDVQALTFYAAEYYDGKIYAYTESGEFYVIDEETKEPTRVSLGDGTYIYDMAYDYSTGYMYAIDADGSLLRVDILSGNYEYIGNISDDWGGVAACIAISTDGVIYVMTSTGMLYTVEVTEEETDWGTDYNLTLNRLGYNGIGSLYYVQSMTYDHNTDTLYWAVATDNAEGIAYVDKNTGEAIMLGAPDSIMQLVGLYVVPGEEAELPANDVAVESVSVLNNTAVVLEGAKTVAPLSITPWNAGNKEFTYEILSGEEFIEIEDGIITGVAKGTATVAATPVANTNWTTNFDVKVLESAGDISGNILYDMAMNSGGFWADFKDNDLAAGGVAHALTDVYNVYAGEYYDGYMYAYAEDTSNDDWENAYMFLTIDAHTTETYEGEEYLTYEIVSAESVDITLEVRDMAFNYANGTMYAIAGTRNADGNPGLYNVDIETGARYKIGDLSSNFFGLACSTEGQLYGVDEYGDIYEINSATGECSYLLSTGANANAYQSMAYDHNTGNLYWAQTYTSQWTGNQASLYVIDLETDTAIELGMVGASGCQITAMYIMPEADSLPEPAETVEPEGIRLSTEAAMLLVEEQLQVSAVTVPLSNYVESGEITFSSNDETVATVTADGLITAVGSGATEIVATCGDIEATCKISVVGDEYKLYALGYAGYEIADLANATTVDSTKEFTEEMNFVVSEYNPTDEMFYAIDDAGMLWKYDSELNATQITTTAIADTFEDSQDYISYEFYTNEEKGYVSNAFDLVYNEFDGNMYVAIRGCEKTYEYTYPDGSTYVYCSEHYYFAKLDVETGATTYLCELGYDFGIPGEFVFVDEKKVLVYDTMQDNINSFIYDDVYEIYTYDEVTYEPILAGFEATYYAEAYVGSPYAVIETAGFGMFYSKDLDLVFIAGQSYRESTNEIILCYYNPTTQVMTKWVHTGFTPDNMIDIAIIKEDAE